MDPHLLRGSNQEVTMNKYVVRLSEAERQLLSEVIKKGKSPAYKIKHAHILLATDEDGLNQPDREVAKNYGCHLNTVANVRQRFVELGFETALHWNRPKNPPRTPSLEGEGEARLLKIACSKPPEGRSTWTLRMMADELVELEIVDSISYETVRQYLKKTRSSRT